MGTAYCSHIGWLVGRASATLEGDIHLLNMKGSAIVTIVYSLYSWRGLLITGSVMSEAAGRVSVVGLRRLPFIPKRDSCGLLRVRIILANVD